jgi:hypothetical protein
MALPQDHVSAPATHAASKGAAIDGAFPRAGGSGAGPGRTIEAAGHMHATLQTVQSGAVAPATVLLEGSNDGANWKTLATNAHAGNDARFAEVNTMGYRFFRARKSVDCGAGDFVDYFLRLTGHGQN